MLPPRKVQDRDIDTLFPVKTLGQGLSDDFSAGALVLGTAVAR